MRLRRSHKRAIGDATRQLVVALAILSPLATVAAADGVQRRWWKKRGKVCPGNAKLKGAAPPHGFDVACVKRSGVWHGPRTTWFDKCKRASPCKAGKARIRFQGAYNRGIEHGPWVFWHKGGGKGLEGEYFQAPKRGKH